MNDLPSWLILIITLVFICSNCTALIVDKNIQDRTKTYHIVKQGETIWRIAKKYNVSVDQILRYNNISDVTNVSIGQKIYIPSRKYKPKVSFIWPLHGNITRNFNLKSLKQHHGIDIAALKGTKILAAQSGKIIFSGHQKGYGNMIVIRHDSEFSTIYAHNNANLVSLGQKVSQGDVVATVGNTGNATGHHLHFEIRKGKNPLDPLVYLP